MRRVHLSDDVDIRDELALHATVPGILKEGLACCREVIAVVEYEGVVRRGLVLWAVLLEGHLVGADPGRLAKVELCIGAKRSIGEAYGRPLQLRAREAPELPRLHVRQLAAPITQLLGLRILLPPLTLSSERNGLVHFPRVVILAVLLLSDDLEKHAAELSEGELGGERLKLAEREALRRLVGD